MNQHTRDYIDEMCSMLSEIAEGTAVLAGELPDPTNYEEWSVLDRDDMKRETDEIIAAITPAEQVELSGVVRSLRQAIDAYKKALEAA